MCCLAFLYACGGFKKEKSEKVARSTKAAKKLEIFVRNMFFRQTVFSL